MIQNVVVIMNENVQIGWKVKLVFYFIFALNIKQSFYWEKYAKFNSNVH